MTMPDWLVLLVGVETLVFVVVVGSCLIAGIYEGLVVDSREMRAVGLTQADEKPFVRDGAANEAFRIGVITPNEARSLVTDPSSYGTVERR